MIAYTDETSGLSVMIRAAVSIKFGVAVIGSCNICAGGGGGGNGTPNGGGGNGDPETVCKLFNVS